eukprot:5067896-Pyramimonas_sp.AAC.2
MIFWPHARTHGHDRDDDSDEGDDRDRDGDHDDTPKNPRHPKSLGVQTLRNPNAPTPKLRLRRRRRRRPRALPAAPPPPAPPQAPPPGSPRPAPAPLASPPARAEKAERKNMMGEVEEGGGRWGRTKTRQERLRNLRPTHPAHSPVEGDQCRGRRSFPATPPARTTHHRPRRPR